jgi:hypothetical protein
VNENERLLEEQERLSWIMAGMSTAALGWLKPPYEYAGQPIPQIEDVVRLRAAFEIACEALKPFYACAQNNPTLTTNDVMCQMQREAEKAIKRIRNAYIPPSRHKVQ